MNKGVIFDFANEVSEYSDFLFWLLPGQISRQIADRLAVELLNTHVECTLDKQLYIGYRSHLDIHSGIVAAIESLTDVNVKGVDHDKIANFVNDMGHVLYRVIFDRFADVSMMFALWHVKPVVAGVILVEYQGDYRIIEWHNTNGVENEDDYKEVNYEFEAGHIHQYLRDRLGQFRGRYAGRVFNQTINHLFRVVIEEFIFENKCSYNRSPLTGETIISQYIETEDILLKNFPLMATEDVNCVIVDLEQIISTGVRKRITMTTSIEDVINWDIRDKNIHITIERPVNKKIEANTILKNDIQTSIDNGDYIPPAMRDIVGKL